MKKDIKTIIVVTFILTAFLFSCNSRSSNDGLLPSGIVNNPSTASGDASAMDIAAITFAAGEHDFGKVIQGEKVTYAFKFENSGKDDLIVSDVSTSCGCTTPGFTSEPVKPGGTGIIKVTFDSSNRKGFQNKTVTVVTNTQPNTNVLQIKAMVVVPEKY